MGRNNENQDISVVAAAGGVFPRFWPGDPRRGLGLEKSHECKPVSPAIRVTGIPADARSLAVSMIDHDMRSYDHGGGSVAVSGDSSFTLPEGALQGYKGPCPPNFRSFGHDYEFIVRAIGADGKTELARGSKVKTFSASTVKE